MGQPRDKLRTLAGICAMRASDQACASALQGGRATRRRRACSIPHWFETPHYLVETLRQFGEVSNAAQLFMHPADGLRAINEADQIACFEYAATKSSTALRRLIAGRRPGMTEFEACRTMGLDGSMQSVHINMSSGPRARYGLCSPSAPHHCTGRCPSSWATA